MTWALRLSTASLRAWLPDRLDGNTPRGCGRACTQRPCSPRRRLRMARAASIEHDAFVTAASIQHLGAACARHGSVNHETTLAQDRPVRSRPAGHENQRHARLVSSAVNATSNPASLDLNQTMNRECRLSCAAPGSGRRACVASADNAWPLGRPHAIATQLAGTVGWLCCMATGLAGAVMHGLGAASASVQSQFAWLSIFCACHRHRCTEALAAALPAQLACAR